MTNRPDDIVGHKTFVEGPLGVPGSIRHEPLTRAEGEAIWEAAVAAEKDRSLRMPTEQDALLAMFDAYQRLKEIGWREGIYCPKDGSKFRVIESGSTGIFDCVCEGEWPRCTWTTFDEHDAYPSSHPPLLFRRYPDDEAKERTAFAEAVKRFHAQEQP